MDSISNGAEPICVEVGPLEEDAPATGLQCALRDAITVWKHAFALFIAKESVTCSFASDASAHWEAACSVAAILRELVSNADAREAAGASVASWITDMFPAPSVLSVGETEGLCVSRLVVAAALRQEFAGDASGLEHLRSLLLLNLAALTPDDTTTYHFILMHMAGDVASTSLVLLPEADLAHSASFQWLPATLASTCKLLSWMTVEPAMLQHVFEQSTFMPQLLRSPDGGASRKAPLESASDGAFPACSALFDQMVAVLRCASQALHTPGTHTGDLVSQLQSMCALCPGLSQLAVFSCCLHLPSSTAPSGSRSPLHPHVVDAACIAPMDVASVAAFDSSLRSSLQWYVAPVYAPTVREEAAQSLTQLTIFLSSKSARGHFHKCQTLRLFALELLESHTWAAEAILLGLAVQGYFEPTLRGLIELRVETWHTLARLLTGLQSVCAFLTVPISSALLEVLHGRMGQLGFVLRHSVDSGVSLSVDIATDGQPSKSVTSASTSSPLLLASASHSFQGRLRTGVESEVADSGDGWLYFATALLHQYNGFGCEETPPCPLVDNGQLEYALQCVYTCFRYTSMFDTVFLDGVLDTAAAPLLTFVSIDCPPHRSRFHASNATKVLCATILGSKPSIVSLDTPSLPTVLFAMVCLLAAVNGFLDRTGLESDHSSARYSCLQLRVALLVLMETCARTPEGADASVGVDSVLATASSAATAIASAQRIPSASSHAVNAMLLYALRCNVVDTEGNFHNVVDRWCGRDVDLVLASGTLHLAHGLEFLLALHTLRKVYLEPAVLRVTPENTATTMDSLCGMLDWALAGLERTRKAARKAFQTDVRVGAPERSSTHTRTSRGGLHHLSQRGSGFSPNRRVLGRHDGDAGSSFHSPVAASSTPSSPTSPLFSQTMSMLGTHVAPFPTSNDTEYSTMELYDARALHLFAMLCTCVAVQTAARANSAAAWVRLHDSLLAGFIDCAFEGLVDVMSVQLLSVLPRIPPVLRKSLIAGQLGACFAAFPISTEACLQPTGPVICFAMSTIDAAHTHEQQGWATLESVLSTMYTSSTTCDRTPLANALTVDVRLSVGMDVVSAEERLCLGLCILGAVASWHVDGERDVGCLITELCSFAPDTAQSWMSGMALRLDTRAALTITLNLMRELVVRYRVCDSRTSLLGAFNAAIVMGDGWESSASSIPPTVGAATLTVLALAVSLLTEVVSTHVGDFRLHECSDLAGTIANVCTQLATLSGSHEHIVAPPEMFSADIVESAAVSASSSALTPSSSPASTAPNGAVGVPNLHLFRAELVNLSSVGTAMCRTGKLVKSSQKFFDKLTRAALQLGAARPSTGATRSWTTVFGARAVPATVATGEDAFDDTGDMYGIGTSPTITSAPRNPVAAAMPNPARIITQTTRRIAPTPVDEAEEPVARVVLTTVSESSRCPSPSSASLLSAVVVASEPPYSHARPPHQSIAVAVSPLQAAAASGYLHGVASEGLHTRVPDAATAVGGSGEAALMHSVEAQQYQMQQYQMMGAYMAHTAMMSMMAAQFQATAAAAAGNALAGHHVSPPEPSDVRYRSNHRQARERDRASDSTRSHSHRGRRRGAREYVEEEEASEVSDIDMVRGGSSGVSGDERGEWGGAEDEFAGVRHEPAPTHKRGHISGSTTRAKPHTQRKWS